MITNDVYDQQNINLHYQKLIKEYGETEGSIQVSTEGIIFRIKKLLTIDNLNGKNVLDLGSGLGHFYSILKNEYPDSHYTGIDIVPEMVEIASRKWPEAEFVLCDVLNDGFPKQYDYIFMSGIFNNFRDDKNLFMLDMLKAAFNNSVRGIGFNFISINTNFKSPSLSYQDPAVILNCCLHNLGPKIIMHHHYERCDVSVFVYR